jgi:hypothetical protein
LGIPRIYIAKKPTFKKRSSWVCTKVNGFAHIDMFMKNLSSFRACPCTCLDAHGAIFFNAKNIKSYELLTFEIEKFGCNANCN